MRSFTMDDLSHWNFYALEFFLDVLNGSYLLEDARNDLDSLRRQDEQI